MAKSQKLRVLMPLPSFDFDPSEAAITWRVLTDNGVDVHFATPDGKPAVADPRMLHGTGLSVFKRILMARQDAVEACLAMYEDINFRKPIAYKKVSEKGFDGLVLPGGHAQGMRIYLEAPELHKVTSAFFAKKKPVAAICHGVVLAARAKSKDGKSVLLSDNWDIWQVPATAGARAVNLTGDGKRAQIRYRQFYNWADDASVAAAGRGGPARPHGR